MNALLVFVGLVVAFWVATSLFVARKTALGSIQVRFVVAVLVADAILNACLFVAIVLLHS